MPGAAQISVDASCCWALEFPNVTRILSCANPNPKSPTLESATTPWPSSICGQLLAIHHTPLNALNPPSTGTTIPVTNFAASEQSHTVAPINSAASPNRLIGV